MSLIQPWPKLSETPSGIQLKSDVKALRSLLSDEAVQRGLRLAKARKNAKEEDSSILDDGDGTYQTYFTPWLN